jgi:hypothetical protein
MRVPYSYDYGTLMHLTQFILALTYLDETRPGEPYLPKRVSGFHEWAKLLTTIVYSAYLLDEASAEDGTIPGAKGELYQIKDWESLFSSVEPVKLRNAVLSTPGFPGVSPVSVVVVYPLHYPDDFKEASRKQDDLLMPAKVRAANRLARRASEVSSKTHPEENQAIFWPQWDVVDGKATATGHRLLGDATTVNSWNA